ncbi:MAG: serine/threonine-protein phosphatase [Clostridia bacterium]|jgi:serine/threonine protein phosphatase PrpC|nr:serine/threonine-protein phosphatase [Clostridia bacterium]
MEWDGYKGGEIASKLAIEAVRRYIEGHFNEIEHQKENIMELISSAMDYANNVVFDKSKNADELKGMGTTLEICLIYNNRAYIGHIGDSRTYRIRGEIMRKLTQDHSYVETLVKGGTITKEEAKHHPKKNMLMKALRMWRNSRTRCNG